MDAVLVARQKELVEQYFRDGYLMLRELLRREAFVVNRKRTYRLYRDLGMQVSTKKRKKLVRQRIPLEVPTGGEPALVSGFCTRSTLNRPSP